MVGGGRVPDPGRPTPRQEAPPPGTLVLPPHRAKPARKSARCLAGDGSPRPHAPHGDCAAPSQVGGNGTGPPPPQGSQTEHRTEAGHAEGHGPRGTALPAPSTGTARGPRTTPNRGGGGSAHTHKGHAGKTRRATGQSPRNAQTAWNGVPASEDKGREGGNVEDTTPNTGPYPPDPAASAAHTRPGHCTRQGSSGALRHAPAPRLGSLGASPRGSHWQQASSTAPGDHALGGRRGG